MSRPDAASITLKVSCPPEIIREYFDGLAKVEAAKHSPGIDLSGIASVVAPFLVSFLSGLSKESSKSSKKSKSKTDKTDPSNIIVSVVHSANNDNSSRLVKLESEEIKEEEVEEKVEKKVDKEVKEEVKGEVKEEEKKKPEYKKPVYQDGDNIVLDFNNIAGAFGGANGPNGASITDMMKMFAPMMEGLMGGMAAATTKTEQSPKSAEQSTEQSTNEVSVSEGNID